MPKKNDFAFYTSPITKCISLLTYKFTSISFLYNFYLYNPIKHSLSSTCVSNTQPQHLSCFVFVTCFHLLQYPQFKLCFPSQLSSIFFFFFFFNFFILRNFFVIRKHHLIFRTPLFRKHDSSTLFSMFIYSLTNMDKYMT